MTTINAGDTDCASCGAPPRMQHSTDCTGGQHRMSHNYLPELIMALCGINPICDTCHEALGLCKCKGKDGHEQSM